jgi:transposase
MENVIKQSVGIDCSKDELVCCLSMLQQDLTIKNVSQQTFKNDQKGFKSLLKWSEKTFLQNLEHLFVVEATGVYHEKLAYFIEENGLQISVVLPSKISHYRKSMNLKTDNDKTAAIGIAEFGLVKKLESWKKPEPILRTFRQLLRERAQLQSMLIEVKSMQHAHTTGVIYSEKTTKRFKKQCEFYKSQVKDVEQEIEELLESNPEIKAKVKTICTINGVGQLTVLTIAGETDGFNLIRNKRQLVSYAGLDVVDKSSGTSVRGKSRISKRGNKWIRRALYFPALTAVKHSPAFKSDYARIVKNTAIKMKGVVAIERKLLILIYTLWKSEEAYDPDRYQKIGSAITADPTELDQVRSIEIQR